jgi:light-regulated signal transduction histidine kinase (bacteriophytochrome)
MKVLIIDDTPADHEMCVAYLGGESNGWHFLHAYSGTEGIALYRENAIDCVLLDYHLPDMDGLNVLRALSSQERPVPVIMMTGEGSEMIAVTAMKLGLQDYLPKSVMTSSSLKRAIEHASERAELLQRMTQYRMELERSNRDLEQFATIVAHDLKAPLRAVAQHLSLIKQQSAEALDSKSRRSLEFAVEGADRMRQLIDALFTYAKLGFGEAIMSPVSFETVMEMVLRDMAAIIADHHAIVTYDPLPQVNGDPVLLSQLLQNLIGNAIKYCKEIPYIHVGAAFDNGQWNIAVKDNGIGIPVGQHEKIFTIFRRLHHESEYPGIGLGLAICERIVKRHGGTIGIESEPNVGSTFYFTLPAVVQVRELQRVAYA